MCVYIQDQPLSCSEVKRMEVLKASFTLVTVSMNETADLSGRKTVTRIMTKSVYIHKFYVRRHLKNTIINNITNATK